MCDPLTITGLALTAGSTVLNTVAANQAAGARASALAAERARQTAFDQEAAALNATSQDRYTNFQDKQDAKAQELGTYLAEQTAADPAASEALPTAAGSNITVREEQRQRGKARADTEASAVALGNLRSFGDLLGSIGRDQARDASLIGQIGGFKQGSSGVLPYELEAAAQKGAGLRLLADLAGGFGGLATSAGLSGTSFGSLVGGMKGLAAPKVAASTAATSLRPRANPRLGSIYGG